MTVYERPSGLDDDVVILNVDRKSLRHVGTFGEFLAAFDLDRIGPNLDAFRIEPGVAVAHVEFPTMPRAAQKFADARALIDAGLRRRQPRDAGGLLQWRAFMWTAIEQREERAIDMKYHDVAAVDSDDLVAAERDVGGAGDDVTGHLARFAGYNLYSVRALRLKILARSESESGVLKAKRGSSKSQCG